MHDPSPDQFLAAYPEPMRAIAARLRAIVRQAVPSAIERVRMGWRLIGYDIPAGTRMRYFAYVAPEIEHVHLGFEYGTLLDDPADLLEGAHLNLRKVRYLTFTAAEQIPERDVIELVSQAAQVAGMSRADRSALILTGDLRAPDRP